MRRAVLCFPSYLIKRPHIPATAGFAEANRNGLGRRGECEDFRPQLGAEKGPLGPQLQFLFTEVRD